PCRRRTLAMPRNFLHRPLPYILCNRLRSRIRRPTAMGSIAVISPIISKSMRPQLRQPGLDTNLVYSIHQDARDEPQTLKNRPAPARGKRDINNILEKDTVDTPP